MAVREDLLAEIDSLLQSAGGIGYSEPIETNDIYENYVWLLCVRAAQLQGATPAYVTVTGQGASQLVFRTTPGNIYSQAHPYTHACLTFPTAPPLEVHVGIKVAGRSRVLHECDVAVLSRREADLCRQESVHPRAAKVLIGAECKFYTAAVQLHLGRGFLGLTNEIYREERYFVTNSFSKTVTKLIGHHKAEWQCNVTPGQSDADALMHRLSRAFRNYQTTYG